jgi:hypothetical protein
MNALVARRRAHLKYAGERGWDEANWCVRRRTVPAHGLEIPTEVLALHQEYLDFAKQEASRRITELALKAAALQARQTSSLPPDQVPFTPDDVPGTPGLGRTGDGKSKRVRGAAKPKSSLERTDSGLPALPLATPSSSRP